MNALQTRTLAQDNSKGNKSKKNQPLKKIKKTTTPSNNTEVKLLKLEIETLNYKLKKAQDNNQLQKEANQLLQDKIERLENEKTKKYEFTRNSIFF